MALTPQELLDVFVQELARFYRVSLYKQRIVTEGANDPVRTNNYDPTLTNLYVPFRTILNEGMQQLLDLHSRLQMWATKWAFDFPTGDPRDLQEAQLRTICATTNVLGQPCYSQGYNNEAWPVLGNLYRSFYIIMDGFCTDVLKVETRMRFFIEEAETYFPNNAAREFAALADRVRGQTFAARQYAQGIVEQDISRRQLVGVNGLDAGRAIYGPQHSASLPGGLYLLNENVVCDPPANVIDERVDLIDEMPELLGT
jgi:hypothetical protein